MQDNGAKVRQVLNRRVGSNRVIVVVHEWILKRVQVDESPDDGCAGGGRERTPIEP